MNAMNGYKLTPLKDMVADASSDKSRLFPSSSKSIPYSRRLFLSVEGCKALQKIKLETDFSSGNPWYDKAVDLFLDMEFYDPVNTIKVMSSRSHFSDRFRHPKRLTSTKFTIFRL